MSEFCLKYERVRTEYNEVCEMIGRYLSDEEMYFDFEKNCMCFKEEHSARVYEKYLSKARVLRAELNALRDFLDNK